MKLINQSIVIFISMFTLMANSATADEIKMKLSNTCGVESSYLKIEIYNPPGGYAKVASDGSFTVNAPVGTKLALIYDWQKFCDDECEKCHKEHPGCICNGTVCRKQNEGKFMGTPLTGAKDGRVIEVMCRH